MAVHAHHPRSPLVGSSIPAVAGVGLRHPHVAAFLDGAPATGWVEVHSENYLVDGGPRLGALLAIRQDYPVSCHGVGLSLGSYEGLDPAHLARLNALYEKVEPGLVSEHVAWSVNDGTYLNDLLPLPYTEEALAVVVRNIDQAQTAFRRRILVENPSSYVQFADSALHEWDFMAELAARTGCGILLDVNNVYVSAQNHGFDARTYLTRLPAEAVGEIHLAGHTSRDFNGRTLLIDDHGSQVSQDVWDLYAAALRLTGPKPTLVEWDTGVPELAVLLGEAAKARAYLNTHRQEDLGDAA